MVRDKVEQIVNAMLDASGRRDRPRRQIRAQRREEGYRAGHYERKLTVKAGKLEPEVPEPKGAVFGSAVVERCRRREQSVEESLIDMYLAGVSARRVDDTSQLLWDDRMPSQTAQEGVRGDRGVAQAPAGFGVPVRVHGRRVAQAFLGAVL